MDEFKLLMQRNLKEIDEHVNFLQSEVHNLEDLRNQLQEKGIIDQNQKKAIFLK